MTTLQHTASRRLAGLPRPRRSLAQLFDLYRQRRALAQLDDAALRDIGKTRAEARAEARRPVWDAPAHWR
ncbi:DUF1127 domain-containing protein [Lutimaribacter sp. EGI FJ00015]|uniref:DUF1127 domain-containing protein n=1 Tax=Lutimaribacter degradans TaxID=2945989 RepID=A0ACC5ZWY5_9RHOB|nr:DUF1127 domain-containing protein [Lutimaribacter sp. EGI FJ00013]MCM2562705.1 DUF1127 domain-containing protein [Lutimaribacter sp. EGI FJ00013]MCO0613862.1 DUF1127 domain-containing protein [Lutimaribacter sp. EGI FJ00015]MCO0636655.1 DUF1127 domain-containing protein [Lutimaribacter sp. EGI FJ00014]